MTAIRFPALCRWLAGPMLTLGLALSLTGCVAPGTPGGRPDSHEAPNIAGKTYVITGAASPFGRALALQLASMRANVVLAAPDVELLSDIAAGVSAAGGRPLVAVTDVARPEDIERLAALAVAKFGRIDAWINNAAVGAVGRFDEIPLEEQGRLIDVNLKGTVYGSHAALRQFRKQRAGALVNIGTAESGVPLAYQASYAASRAALLSLERALNDEIRLAALGDVTASTVMPCAADVPMFRYAASYSGDTPRLLSKGDAQRVIDAIVWNTLPARQQQAAGWKERAAHACRCPEPGPKQQTRQ